MADGRSPCRSGSPRKPPEASHAAPSRDQEVPESSSFDADEQTVGVERHSQGGQHQPLQGSELTSSNSLQPGLVEIPVVERRERETPSDASLDFELCRLDHPVEARSNVTAHVAGPLIAWAEVRRV